MGGHRGLCEAEAADRGGPPAADEGPGRPGEGAAADTPLPRKTAPPPGHVAIRCAARHSLPCDVVLAWMSP